MRNVTFVLAVLVAALLGFAVRTVLEGPDRGRREPESERPHPSGETPPGPAVAPPAVPTLSPASKPTVGGAEATDPAIAARLEALEAEVRRLREDLSAALDALAKRVAAVGDVQVHGPAWAHVEDEPAEVERVKAAWRKKLDVAERFGLEMQRLEGEKRFLRDPAKLEKARAAIDGARTLDDLRRLTEGEFTSDFVWPKR
jgi:hypothetical protein